MTSSAASRLRQTVDKHTHSPNVLSAKIGGDPRVSRETPASLVTGAPAASAISPRAPRTRIGCRVARTRVSGTTGRVSRPRITVTGGGHGSTRLGTRPGSLALDGLRARLANLPVLSIALPRLFECPKRYDHGHHQWNRDHDHDQQKPFESRHITCFLGKSGPPRPRPRPSTSVQRKRDWRLASPVHVLPQLPVQEMASNIGCSRYFLTDCRNVATWAPSSAR